MPTGAPASKKATTKAAPAGAGAKTAAPAAEKKVAAAGIGSGATSTSGSSATQSTLKAGAAGKAPRKSVDGSPSSGRRASNSSTGASNNQSAKGAKTGAPPRASKASQKEAAPAAAETAIDTRPKSESPSAVEVQLSPEPPVGPGAGDAPPAPALSPTPAAANSTGVPGADEKAARNAEDALVAEPETTDPPATSDAGPAAAGIPPLVCLLGPPCSGKGTVARSLKQQVEVEHISTGDLLRAAAKDQGEDSQIGELMKSGGLVPDTVVADLLKKELGRLADIKGAVLDGFPRNAEQVKLMQELRLYPRVIIVLKVPQEVLLRRMSGRRLDPVTGEIFGEGCEPEDEEQRQRLVQRDDDKPEILQRRLEDYEKNLASILSGFRDIGCGAEVSRKEGEKRAVDAENEQQQGGPQRGCNIVEIEGDRDVKQVLGDVSSVIEKILTTEV